MGFRVYSQQPERGVVHLRAGGTLAGSPLRDEAPTLDWAKAIVDDQCREHRMYKQHVTAWVENEQGKRVYERSV